MNRGLTDDPTKNPFDLKKISGVKSIRDVERDRSPKVVITSQASLEAGFGRELFAQWSRRPENLIAFTCTYAGGANVGSGRGIQAKLIVTRPYP
jgi:predicted metal-dependent RNase